MPPVNYRVSEPGSVLDAFRALTARARAEGWAPLLAGAAQYMYDELAYDPVHLGESRGRFESMDLDYRVAFVRPLLVEFMIHELTRQVFIRRIALGE
jgi:hypothetical protein